MKNQMELTFLSQPENEAFARMVISAFLVRVNPTLSVVSEVRTAVSEAVTNAVVHTYDTRDGRILLRAGIEGDVLTVEVEDFGRGIANVEEAMQPFFTTFMDVLRVQSAPDCGTVVHMEKSLVEA